MHILSGTIIPSFTFNKDYLLNIVALLGTNNFPLSFFWQADEEVEEEIEHHQLRAMGKGCAENYQRDIREMRLDTIVGMLFQIL